MKSFAWFALTAAALLATAPSASAHFHLLEPQSWIEENNLGDPQKLGPCGGTSANAGTPTNAVTKVTGGTMLHIKVQETVYHPGHYRVSLAQDRANLPADPDASTRDTQRGAWSIRAPIQDPAKPPVLADGLFQHTQRVIDPLETEVQIPNINCDHCTLQITQFMAEHAYNKDGGYYYHHCADLQITADPSKPIDTRFPVKK